MRCTARTHRGHWRQGNEDRFVPRPDIGLFAVADGMGGLVRGDHASRAVADALQALPAGLSGDALLRQLRHVVEEVNRRLFDESVSFGASGTTLVALCLCGSTYRVLWAGDSRAGLYRAGRLRWLTSDHNLAARLVREGRMDDEAARRHPLASRLFRAVGIEAELELDETAGRCRPGDRFILCSDGLTGELTDAEISGCLEERDPETAADRLLASVLAGPARDNVTFVLVDPDA